VFLPATVDCWSAPSLISPRGLPAQVLAVEALLRSFFSFFLKAVASDRLLLFPFFPSPATANIRFPADASAVLRKMTAYVLLIPPSPLHFLFWSLFMVSRRPPFFESAHFTSRPIPPSYTFEPRHRDARDEQFILRIFFFSSVNYRSSAAPQFP